METPEILHEDEAIIAVSKPAGIATANVPADEPSVFTLVRARLAARVPGGRAVPFLGVVSRLDRPVSGVLVFAKSPAAAAALAGQFRERTVEKTYVAVVEGRFPAPLDTWVEWHDSLVRPRRGPTRRVSEPTDASAVEARIRARVLVRRGEGSLVEVVPDTGRRHQIRAQLADRGCPIVGDRAYGARLPFAEGIALHARSLVLVHPASGRRQVIAAEPPPAWRTRFGPLLGHLPPPPDVHSAGPAANMPPRPEDAR